MTGQLWNVSYSYWATMINNKIRKSIFVVKGPNTLTSKGWSLWVQRGGNFRVEIAFVWAKWIPSILLCDPWLSKSDRIGSSIEVLKWKMKCSRKVTNSLSVIQPNLFATAIDPSGALHNHFFKIHSRKEIHRWYMATNRINCKKHCYTRAPPCDVNPPIFLPFLAKTRLTSVVVETEDSSTLNTRASLIFFSNNIFSAPFLR